MRDQILATALKMFNEQGYVEVGMRQIARQLDISPGNLTYHFKKKEDILFALLNDFSSENNSYYKYYETIQPDLLAFLEMMEKILSTQFKYRGVYIGNQVVQIELQDKKRFDYKAVAAKRVASFQQMFRQLCDVGHLKANEDEILFLVSFITLFARFWISEATLFNRNPDSDKTITYYLNMLSKELSLFATKKGKKRIEAFPIGRSK
ncbi:MAG: TetR/AcrR family transcriptional regulator [Saprospiraceae bacterium]|nr:TetR/AcrR family transcriptional regulator [Saprospiraceae bacterium]